MWDRGRRDLAKVIYQMTKPDEMNQIMVDRYRDIAKKMIFCRSTWRVLGEYSRLLTKEKWLFHVRMEMFCYMARTQKNLPVDFWPLTIRMRLQLKV